jgi:3D (Asp-Asp-Asp) domain-containing protein
MVTGFDPLALPPPAIVSEVQDHRTVARGTIPLAADPRVTTALARGASSFERVARVANVAALPAAPRSYRAIGTGYYPDASPLEGGFVDRQDQPLRTLQDFLAGRATYVSVAMDKQAFPYGTKLQIPELEAKYGRPIEFRVVDTGKAFRRKGTSRIDICTANERASMDATINGPLTLIPR